MARIKSFLAIMICVFMAFSLTSCHPANEVAVTVGGVDISTSLYLCMLIQADGEARSTVDEDIAETEEAKSEAGVDYFSKNIDDVKYVDWVNARTLELCQSYAAKLLKFEESDLELDEENKSSIETLSQYYWNNYGYGSLYVPNGVSIETYKEYLSLSYIEDAYFRSLYGQGSKGELSEKNIKDTLNDNFVLAYDLSAEYLESSTGEEASDEEIATMKAQLEGYKKRLEKGESFKTIYNEYNDITEKDQDTTDDTAGEKYASPADSLASVLGGEETTSPSVLFNTVKKMKTGSIQIIDDDEQSTFHLVVKLDILDDPYYYKGDTYYNTVAYLIKGDAFTEEVTKYAKTLTVKKHSFALGALSPKKLVYPKES